MDERTRSSAIASRSAEPSVSTCCWPTNSSSCAGATAARAARPRPRAARRRPRRGSPCRKYAPRVAATTWHRGDRPPQPPDPGRHDEPAGERNRSRGSSFRRTSRRAASSAQLYARVPQRASLVARIRGTGDGPTLLFLSHTDVVLADAASGQSRRSRAKSRRRGLAVGALDMKGQVAASAVAIAWLAREGSRRPAN